MLLARAARRALLAVAAAAAASCAPPSGETVSVRRAGASFAGLQAYCTVEVQGAGAVDVEGDYLPRVVACENGAADDEALRAQAVAARSYLYYRLATGDGTIGDSQADQVYTCNNQPSQRHYDAVASTAGEVLQFQGTLVAAFYVAGAVPSQGDCVAVGGDNDYSSTEQWVTYNWGRSGSGLEQTPLGWVNANNHANRGCQSQNGAHCLSESGWSYEDILRFYYGMDIDHVVAEGPCVAPTGLPHGCGLVVDGTEVVYDETSTCFFRSCASAPAWAERDVGVGASSLLTGGYASAERDCFGRWQLSFAQAGEYAVDVHIPDVEPRVSDVSYLVRHQGQDSAVLVDQSAVSGWVSLGTFSFGAGSLQYVELSDTAAENGTVASGPFVVFDAVRVRPAGTQPSDAGDVPLEDAGQSGGADAGPFEDGDAGSDDDDAGPAVGELPPSVIYVCACAALEELRVPAPGLFAFLLGVSLIAVRRRPSRRR